MSWAESYKTVEDVKEFAKKNYANGIAPSNMLAMSAAAGDGLLKLNFREPADTIIDGQLVCTVKGCVVVMKEGSAPENEDDGVVVARTEDGTETPLGAYAEQPLVIDGLTNDTPYYFRFFPFSDYGLMNHAKTNIISAAPKAYELYGFRINKNDSNPATRIEYTEGAVGFTPAKMDFARGVFDYGSWANAFFIVKNKPAMVKSNGVIDYYLDENDQTKKADGSASDISNTSYGGNAMSIFPTIWFKRWEEGNYEYCNISDVQIDSSYKAYAHTRADGTIMDWVGLSMFKSSVISNKARSLAGQAIGVSGTADNEINYAKANGSLWYTRSWAHICMVADLLRLIGRSDNAQATFGYGRGVASAQQSTGTLKNKGRFFGYSQAQSTTNSVKTFFIEDFWGNVWERIAGLMNLSGKIYTKMTPPYNTTGSGYTNTGLTPAGTSGGYVDRTKMADYGRVPYNASGSETTYACDGLWFNNSQTDYALFGGNWGDAGSLGFSCVVLSNAASSLNAGIGACLSIEQPA